MRLLPARILPAFLAALCVLLGPALAGGDSQRSSRFDPAVGERPNPTDAPRDYAHAMYRSIVARLAFGQSQSVVEPLFYMAEADPGFPDVQNALAVSIFFGQSVRRSRALLYAQRASEADAEPVFQVVRQLADPARARIEPDGSVSLTETAAQSFRAAAASLENGSANQRMLAEILRDTRPSSRDDLYRYQFGGFERLAASPRLLVTSPPRERFAQLEATIEERLRGRAAEAGEARARYEQARAWLDDVKERWESASPEEKTRLEAESERKQAEFERWLAEAEARTKTANVAFARFEAFLGRDYTRLAELRIATPEDREAERLAALTAPDVTRPPDAGTRTVSRELLGRYVALVVSNIDYQALEPLRTAHHDGEEVAALLRDAYGFEVTHLKDVTRSQLIDALYRLRASLGEQDNLLVYYAGHGYYDESADRGYWLPVDALEKTPTNWISNSDITDQIRAIQAKHVIVVADSCYSGTLTRGLAIRPPDAGYIEKMAGRRARLVLTSGGNEPVDDGGASGHSVFANALLESLRANPDVLDATTLFQQVRTRVANSARAKQVPQYGTLRDAEHEGGDFLFVRASALR